MFHRDNPSPKDFTEWRDKSRAFQELSAFTGGTFDIARVDQPELISQRTCGVCESLQMSFLCCWL
jgi:hypothetical protein